MGWVYKNYGGALDSFVSIGMLISGWLLARQQPQWVGNDTELNSSVT